MVPFKEFVYSYVDFWYSAAHVIILLLIIGSIIDSPFSVSDIGNLYLLSFFLG